MEIIAGLDAPDGQTLDKLLQGLVSFNFDLITKTVTGYGSNRGITGFVSLRCGCIVINL